MKLYVTLYINISIITGGKTRPVFFLITKCYVTFRRFCKNIYQETKNLFLHHKGIFDENNKHEAMKYISRQAAALFVY